MKIPDYIKNFLLKLQKNNFEAFLVGGCVRDLLMKKEPKDWDITTNARPKEVLKIFPEAKYENRFGTVILPVRDKDNQLITVIEITTYRSEQGYADHRHPDKVKFEDSLEKDLHRRDFTINALALSINKNLAKSLESHAIEINNYILIDLFGGQKDIKKKIIRAVGEPLDRFKEDALRMMRAIRFACQLGFKIEPKTQRAILKLAGSIKFIAKERIRDELIKILASPNPADGIMFLYQTKLLHYIIPELEAGIGVGQKGHHTYTVFKHSVLSLKYCPSTSWQVRLAALLHDIGKPKTRRIINGEVTFYNHDLVGARMTEKIMRRLRFSSKDIEKVVTLVKNHMFYYNVGEVTEASVRRLIAKVGRQNLKDLIDLRIADRLGSGVPKAKPYKLRHLEYMLEKVQHDPVSVKMLKINGNDLMRVLNIEPGPRIGAILDILLAEVIEDPKRNTKKHLETRAQELNKLNLDELRKKARQVIADKQAEDDKKLKQKFWVK